MAIADFAHSYKHLWVEVDQEFPPYIAMVDGGGGEPVYAKLNTKPFGSRMAPRNWEE